MKSLIVVQLGCYHLTWGYNPAISVDRKGYTNFYREFIVMYQQTFWKFPLRHYVLRDFAGDTADVREVVAENDLIFGGFNVVSPKG